MSPDLKPHFMRCLRLFLTFVLFLQSGSVLADNVVVAKPGGGVVLQGDTLAELGRFSLESEVAPKVAVHPADPILATLTPDEGLIFWNLPQMSEASRHESPLFKGEIISMEFSADGDHLYLLAPDLRAVVVFHLASSKVVRMLPVTGGVPIAMEVTSDGVMIQQEQSFSVLSPDPEEGLLSQFRYPTNVLSGLRLGDRFYLSLRGAPGLWTYQYSTGRTLGILPLNSEVYKMVAAGTSLVLATPQGLQSQSLTSAGAGWAVPGGATAFDALLASKDRGRVYAFDVESGVVVTVDTASGQQLSQATVPESSQIAVFSTP